MAISRICKIEDCGKQASRRGWCVAHYTRFRRHGDPLGGRTPNGEALRFFRDVVLTDKRGPDDPCLIWPFSAPRYGQLRLADALQSVSRLVCTEVHGEPPTPDHEAAHSCGKGHEACATPGHLRWATAVENNADKLIHDTHGRGERCPTHKLTTDEVVQIRQMLALNDAPTKRKIAERFGVSPSAISHIHFRTSWAWL